MPIRRNHHKPPSMHRHSPMVYFLIRGDHIKIGTTTNLPKRIRVLSQPLSDVLGVVPGGYDVEARWHRRFAHLQDTTVYAGREWFHATDELLDAVAVEAVTTRGQWESSAPDDTRSRVLTHQVFRSPSCAL